MIFGPYSVCKMSDKDDGSDGFIMTTLKWGYGSAQDAFDDIPSLAKIEKVAQDELCVIRLIDKEEKEKFSD